MKKRIDKDHAPRPHHEWLQDKGSEAVSLDKNKLLEALVQHAHIPLRQFTLQPRWHTVRRLDRGQYAEALRLAPFVRSRDLDSDLALLHSQRRRSQPVAAAAVPRHMLTEHTWLTRVHRPDRVAMITALQTQHVPFARLASTERAGAAAWRGACECR